MVICIILVVFLIAYASYATGKKSVRTSEVTKAELFDMVEKLQELEAISELIKRHKEAEHQLFWLKELVHDFFFFRELKYPKKVFDEMGVQLGVLKGRTWDKEEAEAVALLIDEIRKQINEEWLKDPLD